MPAKTHRLWLALLMLLSITSSLAANDTVAGRTLAEWASDVNSQNPVIRNRAVLTLPQFGAAAVPHLEAALNSSDPAVIYWAASGLGDLQKITPEGTQQLQALLDHDLISVRISAAYALCRNGDLDAGLPVLIKHLKHPIRGIANSNADFLARIGPPAKEALPALDQALKDPDYHIQGAALDAVRKIRGEE